MKPGLIVTVQEGSSSNVDLPWELTTDAPITLGTTALTFAKLGGGYFVAKDSEVYNVLDHGVKGSGTTDDTDAINALITSVAVAQSCSRGALTSSPVERPTPSPAGS